MPLHIHTSYDKQETQKHRYSQMMHINQYNQFDVIHGVQHDRYPET